MRFTIKNLCSQTTVFILVLCVFICSLNAQDKIDEETGFIIAKGFKIVNVACTLCHSSQIIIQSRSDRDGWLETIRRMQDEEGMVNLDSEVEKEILDYLSTCYGWKDEDFEWVVFPTGIKTLSLFDNVKYEKSTFAWVFFWYIEYPFERLEGKYIKFFINRNINKWRQIRWQMKR